jgi:hypothetical protein
VSGTDAPREHYRLRAEESDREAARVEALARRISHFRAGAFLLTALPLLLLETSDRARWPLLLTWAAVAAVLFVVLVVRHRKVKVRGRRLAIRGAMAREGEARLDRVWSRLPPLHGEPAPGDHPSAADLDLVGPSSLLRLLNRTTTAPGLSLLRRWILDPLAPDPLRAAALLGAGDGGEAEEREAEGGTLRTDAGWEGEVVRRQRAVNRLAPETGFREALELAGREVRGREAIRPSRIFVAWARSDPWLPGRAWIRWLGIGFALFNPLTLLGWFTGVVPGIIPLFGCLGALALHGQVAKEAGRRLDAAEAGEGALERWTAILRALGQLPEEDEEDGLLREVKATLAAPGTGAADALRALRRIADTAGVRRSSLAHFPLVAIFSWDVHMLAWLEGWQRRHGSSVGGWILALARAEALSSLAGLRYDHPHWTFPTFDPAMEAGIRGTGLGHPLLPPAKGVPNDVELPPPGRLLLVTGSNMAGKTTLLRALGVNQVLALMGAPVAARNLVTRPAVPWTAMRIRDSLTEGVSYFLAELRRIRRLVDAARTAPVLYLLDEILQGTNTAERRTAARIVLTHLLRTGSVGAVTTHDLTLADHPELEPHMVQVHFREEVRELEGKKRLDFDYLLRSGPATSRNALLLLEMVGLGPEDGDPE